VHHWIFWLCIRLRLTAFCLLQNHEKVDLMPRYLIRLSAILLFVVQSVMLAALVPPHPKYLNPPAAWENTRIESSVFTGVKGSKPVLPNTILVLRVQFSDKSFRTTAAYPDNLPHDAAFFDRWMVHLKDYFLEASHLQYELVSALYPQVLTLPNPMSYYGGDASDKIDANLPHILPDIMAQIDNEVDFRDFGGVIIFHAGSGQESDITGERTDQVWSTFLTRKNLQAYFEPNNDNYPGFTTNDGAHLTNVILVPEDEYQDYFPGENDENASAYLFSIYGVLAHQFGHVLGLPTLFDNDSSNGISQGIGNWGLMGTGLWNGNGYVPAQPCAWSRCFLGWENPVLITEDSPAVHTVDYFLNHAPDAVRVYKIPLSATEYFLIENRQQNPDGSLNPYTDQYSYSFKLLPEGEQDYYENYPLLPYFNFMENSYLGSEWDFFLPGLGGPIPNNSTLPEDGSGLLIWHIDEAVIAANFTANFDLNKVNANAQHKGVDLEEADHVQNLDTGTADTYKWGSPYDSYRSGNNDYFGDMYHNGLLSLPTAASYYGGAQLEIRNISVSGLQMSFEVSFGWRRSTANLGKNPVNAAAIDFDGDGDNELFYPMPNGDLYLWNNEEIVPEFPLHKMPVTQTYTWDGNSLYIPMQQGIICRLYNLGNTSRGYVLTKANISWASHPVDLDDKLALAFNYQDGSGSEIELFDKTSHTTQQIASFSEKLVANPINYRGKLSMLARDASGAYQLKEIDLASLEVTSNSLPIPADSLVVAAFKAPLNSGADLIVQCPNSVYCLAGTQIAEGFPFVHDLVSKADTTYVAPLSLADVDNNGSLDILIGGERGWGVVDYSGHLISPASLMKEQTGEGISAGIYAADLDGDGKTEFIGNFNNNTLNVWENNYVPKKGFPAAFAERSRTLPFVSRASDNKLYLYAATDNGSLFRKQLDAVPLPNPAMTWNCEYADLKRSASLDPQNLENQFATSSLFVADQVYIYPNPLKAIYGNNLVLNVMPSRDTEIELSIYDIAGTLVFRQKAVAKAYLKNRELFSIPSLKLTSGVYVAVVKAPQESKRLKFAVEK